MSEGNGREPIHEPTLPLFEDEADWLHHAAERFEGSNAEEILTWALERRHGPQQLAPLDDREEQAASEQAVEVAKVRP